MPIRRLVPDDAPAYRTLMLDAYRDHPDAFTSTLEERAAQPLDWWAWRLAPDAGADQRVFGALESGRLLGVAGWQREPRVRTRHRAELFGLMVAEPARGRGMGRALVEAILADLRATAGMIAVRLTVTDGNRAAERLYATCGFVRCGLEPMAVRVGERLFDKAVMWRPLADAAAPLH